MQRNGPQRRGDRAQSLQLPPDMRSIIQTVFSQCKSHPLSMHFLTQTIQIQNLLLFFDSCCLPLPSARQRKDTKISVYFILGAPAHVINKHEEDIFQLVMWQTLQTRPGKSRGEFGLRAALCSKEPHVIVVNTSKLIQGPEMQVSSYAWLAAMGWISKHFWSKSSVPRGKTVPYCQCCFFSPLSSTPLGLGVFSCAPIGLFTLTRGSTRRNVLRVWENKLVTQHLFQLKKTSHSILCLTASWLLNSSYQHHVHGVNVRSQGKYS